MSPGTPHDARNAPEGGISSSQRVRRRPHADEDPALVVTWGQLKSWRILRKLRCCPWRAGQLAKAVHALQVREANAG